MLLTEFRFAIQMGADRIGAFVECTLPTLQWETQMIKEGGVNTYVHQLPTRRKEAKLVLRRGLGLGREIVDWYDEVLKGTYAPRLISIHMINSLHEIVMTWTVEGAYPVKWTGPRLKSDSGKAVAIEALELACGEVSVTYDKTLIPATTDWSRRVNTSVRKPSASR